MSTRQPTGVLILCFIMVALLCSASCKKKETQPAKDQKINVITTLFPLYDFAKHIGQEKAEVVLLLPPGVEPHSFEPKPEDLVRIQKADLFIYTGRFMEPWAEDVLRGFEKKNLIVIDTSHGISLREEKGHPEHRHGEKHQHEKPHGSKKDHGQQARKGHHPEVDPHFWLDFDHAKKMVDAILEGLIQKDPAHREYYARNAEQYKSKLNDLDIKFKEVLSRCKKKVFVHAGHFAFGYLAKRYGLEYLAAYGFSPDAEPSPQKMVELTKTLKRHGLQHIYHEELIAPRVAEALARETGATLLKLHGAHNLTKDEFDRGTTFLSLMEENLKNLSIGLQCQ